MTGTPAPVGRAVRLAYAVAGVAGVLFFVLSVVALGVRPGELLARQMREMAPAHALGLSASELRGRAVYAREGCAYCHTQQVRFLHDDVTRFGAPTLAWETAVDYPHVWGTRRIGPDLARQSGLHPDDWHYAHLFAPRALVHDSVMPSYRGLFDGSPLRPRQEARDLVAYLDSLGRARALAAPEGETHAQARCQCPDDEMAQMAFGAAALTSQPTRVAADATIPALPATSDAARGRDLFATRCASCHGPQGAGDGAGAEWLTPRPANLAAHEYAPGRVAEALWRGVPGTAMQAWRDYAVEDIAALEQIVRALHVGQPEGQPDAALLQRGADVYADHCVQCHGPRGAGDGSASRELRVAPTDLARQRPSLAHARAVIRDGVVGTRMAPWASRLDDADQLAVAHYVRTFFTPERSATP